jgi:mRNA interferase RelE/StbE
VYKIELRRQAIKDFKDIPSEYASLIPRPTDAKKLNGDAGYSLRVGIYRVLYDIDDSLRLVTVYRIKHRREAYR